MVKALHRAGIEVILDVVYNHTAEGGADGPTFCFRGLANDDYYLLDGATASRYADYSGCGNTLNANQPVVRRLILDSLRYWVAEMHVDGFRFDLASVLSRDEDGTPIPRPPILWDIEIGPGPRRDQADRRGLGRGRPLPGRLLRRAIAGRVERPVPRRRPVVRQGRHRQGLGRSRQRLARQPGHLRPRLDREPEQSINFVTCHDGFTLNDLVSYDEKHNEANGEDNRDGSDQNLSWNCGVEGPTDDPAIEALRNRQVKNFLASSCSRSVCRCSDGRRGPPDAARQQQRLLPGQRVELVRLGLVDRNAGLLGFSRSSSAAGRAPANCSMRRRS